MKNVPKQIGPFTVIPLNRTSVRSLSIGSHGMERVAKGKATESHTHRFISLYVAVGLSLVCGSETHLLPQHALVIVPPGVDHSWKPVGKSGEVGSIDNRHHKQKLIAA